MTAGSSDEFGDQFVIEIKCPFRKNTVKTI